MKLITKKPRWWFITGKEWGSVAMCWGNNIYGDEKTLARGDILAHEMHHIKQNKGKWYISLWFLIRSTFDDKFYQKLEFDARQAQLRFIYEASKNK